jgi:DNA-binding GntR family transcriptional regulator
LRQGQPLHEVELSQALDVSRGTVREALRFLQEEKLVEIIPHRGAFVTELSPRTVREVYTLRALLEPYAVRVALENGAYTDEDLEALAALVQRMGELEQEGDVLEISKADLDFHYLICERSDHQLLMELFKSLQSLTRLCMLNIKTYSADLPSDELHHRQILGAIQLGDPAYAAEIITGHINESKSALLAAMEEGVEKEKEVMPKGES